MLDSQDSKINLDDSKKEETKSELGYDPFSQYATYGQPDNDSKASKANSEVDCNLEEIKDTEPSK